MTHAQKQAGEGFRRLSITFRTAAVLGVLAFAGGLKADNPCTAADLAGTWATLPQGILLDVPSPLPAGTFTAAGILTFDGVGTFTGTASSSFAGAILNPFPAVGIYSVTPDCIVNVLETSLNIQFQGPFSKNKNEAVFFEPQQTTITTNVLERMLVSNCNAASLSDSWAIQALGSIFDSPGGTETKFAQNGRLLFDGVGGVTGTTASSFGGSIVDHTVTGTYSVNSNCTFTATLTDETATSSLIFGIFYGTGTQFYFDYSAPPPTPVTPTSLPTFTGWAVGGTGRQAVSAAPAMAASPNPIIVTGGGPGVATITWNAPSAMVIEIHVGSANGPLLTHNVGSGSVTTGAWITDGTTFYLQDVSGGKALTSQNTLATLVVHVTG